jgi:hypothetical protein
VVRTEIDGVEMCPARIHLRRDLRVHRVDHRLREVSAGDPGLVGDENGEEGTAIHEPDGLDGEGEQPEPREMVHVADFLGEGAVAVDEDRAAR